MRDFFKTLSLVLGLTFCVVPPLLWLGVTIDPAGWPKNIFLVGLALFLVLGLAFDLWANRKGLKLVMSPFSLPLVALASAYVISSVFAPNGIQTVVEPIGTATIVALSVIFWLLTGPLWQKNRWFVGLGSLFFGIGAVLAGGISFVSFLSSSLFPAQPFVVTGQALALFPYMAVGFIGGMAFVVTSGWVKGGRESVVKKAIGVLVTGALGIMVVANIWKFWPGRVQYFTFLPYGAGWQVAAQSLKVAPLWGRGPTNFLSAFTDGRPAQLNSDPSLWNVRFFVSSSFPFQLAATVGLLGLAAYGYLVVEIGRTIIREREKLSAEGWGLAAAVIAAVVVQMMLPPTIVNWWLLIAVLTLFTVYLRTIRSSSIEAKEAGTMMSPVGTELAKPGGKAALSLVIGVVLILVCGVVGYFTERFSAAEITYRQGVDVATTGSGDIVKRGDGAAKLISEAVALNPRMDTYHVGLSQVELARADLLAAKGKNFTANDRTNMIKDVQQAISEGKRATEINPLKVTNWENLASLYRSLFNLATGADSFTLAALSQAATLDPTNPNIRLSQGGIYYAMGNFDEAILFFEQAVAMKPDWANAHYNLSAALREKKDYQGAIVEMEKTIALVPSDSSDASKAGAELVALKLALNGAGNASLQKTPSSAKESGSGKTLEKPSPLPVQVVNPALQLGSESGLPTASTTPSPIP